MMDPTVVSSVVEAWKADQHLCDLAATGGIAKVSDRRTIGRLEVTKNVKLLTPVVQYMGTLFALLM